MPGVWVRVARGRSRCRGSGLATRYTRSIYLTHATGMAAYPSRTQRITPTGEMLCLRRTRALVTLPYLLYGRYPRRGTGHCENTYCFGLVVGKEIRGLQQRRRPGACCDCRCPWPCTRAGPTRLGRCSAYTTATMHYTRLTFCFPDLRHGFVGTPGAGIKQNTSRIQMLLAS